MSEKLSKGNSILYILGVLTCFIIYYQSNKEVFYYNVSDVIGDVAGKIFVSGNDTIYVNTTAPSWTELYSHVHTNLPGGHYKPRDCASKQRLAILVPYRDRDHNMRAFLQHIHPFLQRQLLEYRLFVIELVPEIPFNRGALFNIGYKEVTKLDSFDCFFFHDVDLLPETDRNQYLCKNNPKHFSTVQSNHEYRLPYKSFFGGVSAMPGPLYERINGYPNLYFGWGGEDDDIENRIRSNGMSIVRNSATGGRYKQLFHKQQSALSRKNELLETAKNRFLVDGLNSIQYDLLDHKVLPLYTWFKVYINQTKLCDPWPEACQSVNYL